MGHVIKKIIGDFSKDPHYDKLTIEDNSDGKVHIHIKGVRIDMHRDAYNKFREVILIARDKLNNV